MNNLEVIKLLKEYDYLKCEYDYQSELISLSDIAFMKNVESFLDKSVELKEIYKEKTSKTENIESECLSEDENFEVIDRVIENKDPKIKVLFREIAKITHPDKTNNYALSNFYIDSKKFYESNDIIGIYKICSSLSIPFDMDSEEIELLRSNIEELREKILFIKNKISWKWVNVNSEEGDIITFNYIKSKILDDFK